MSWTTAKYDILASIPKQHTSTDLFASTLSRAYQSAIERHNDSISLSLLGAPGPFNDPVVLSKAGQFAMYQYILSICNSNLTHDKELIFLQQIGPAIIQYWSVPHVIIGATGVTTITSPGVWTPFYVSQNTLSLSVLVDWFVTCCRAHLITLTGIYVNNTTGITTPWTGAALLSVP